MRDINISALVPRLWSYTGTRTLTAGSYSIHAQSVQRGVIVWDAAVSNTGAISAVTPTKALAHNQGNLSGGSTPDRSTSRLVMTSSILLTCQTAGTGSGNSLSYEVDDIV